VVNERYSEVGIEPIEIRMRKEIGEVVRPDRLSELPDTIDLLFREQERYRESIVNARAKYVYNFGNSSRTGAEYILSYCGHKTA